MPNTTNNNWPTPADTDLVKNGADAIRDLGNAIDTTLGVYSPVTPGLVKLSTVTFSGVAGQVLPANTFTSTYTRYRILISATGSTNQYVYMRLRTGATDSTTAYGNQALYVDSTTSGGVRNTPGYFELSNALRPAGRFIGEIELFNPQAAAITYGYNRVGSIVAADTTQISMSQHMLIHDVATSYDTANIYTSTGTMTGSVSVYGYNI